MTAEIKRIFELMTPIERDLYQKMQGSIPRDVIPMAPNWRRTTDPLSPFKLSEGGPGLTKRTQFDVDGAIIFGLKETAEHVGCHRGMIDKIRDSRVINGRTIRRLTPYLTKADQRKLNQHKNTAA